MSVQSIHDPALATAARALLNKDGMNKTTTQLSLIHHHTHTCVSARVHACVHPPHTHRHTHRHTHTHTHTQSDPRMYTYTHENAKPVIKHVVLLERD